MIKRLMFAVAGVLLLAAPALAADAPTKKTAQVKSGLYVTAVEAYELLVDNPAAVLVDVRDPIEVMFTGAATHTDIHVPYRLSDRTTFNAAKGIYAMPLNPAFADQVEARLAALGATKETPLVFICRSGSTRSAPAADALFDRGWTNVYTVVDGFEGGKLADGPSKGVRAKDGWRNSGLPWSYTLNKDVVFVEGR